MISEDETIKIISENEGNNAFISNKPKPDDKIKDNIIIEEVVEEVEENYNIYCEKTFQKLEEKAAKAQEAFEKEEKLRKELEGLNSKLLAEKTALLDSLSGEKGCLQEYQEKAAKLTAQKNDLDNQLRVSIKINVHLPYHTIPYVFSHILILSKF